LDGRSENDGGDFVNQSARLQLQLPEIPNGTLETPAGERNADAVFPVN
jgi:hypothetical protein